MRRSLLLSLLAAGLLSAFPASAKLWHVANDGVDSETCGMKTDPCRSITRAILSSSSNDRIRVGPGRYGDLNGDGDFDDPGEELGQVGWGCECMIYVFKPLKIFSSDGATATGLNAGPADIDVVKISGSDIRFGKPNSGFTITLSGIGRGVLIESSATGVRVEGNILRSATTGIADYGVDSVIRRNRAFENHGGAGGFLAHGTNALFELNLAAGNGNGFQVVTPGNVFRRNIACGNLYEGFCVEADATLEENGIVGNRSSGIGFMAGASSVTLTLTENNIFGNGDAPRASSNCGIEFCSLSMSNTVNATGNYWGSATGPGPNPGDEAGSGPCDAGVLNSVATAPADRPLPIKPKPLR
jgi:hypothetical protein